MKKENLFKIIGLNVQSEEEDATRPIIGRLTRGWPAGYLHNTVEELNSWLLRTNQDSSREEDLNQGPPDFKCIALNHSAMLPP